MNNEISVIYDEITAIYDEIAVIYEEYLKSKADYDNGLLSESEYEAFHNGGSSVFLVFVEARAAYDFHHNQIDTHAYSKGTFENKVYLDKIGELIQKINKDSEQ